jgi:hypothetical protein
MTHRRVMGLAALALGLAALGACGDDGPVAHDGGADAAIDGSTPPDAMPAACREFAVPTVQIDEVPARVTGDVVGGGADIASPEACDEANAPFGMEAAGPDRVFQIEGLVPGVAYAVRLDSNTDLAFYVVTGCSTETGPSTGECLLFVDGETQGLEIGRFVAPDAPVYVVVDYFDSQAPSDGVFALELYEVECDDGDLARCGGGTPLCDDFRCVSCTTSFDCSSDLAPVCDTATGSCRAGTGNCIGDDLAPRENGDDGPAGATSLEPGLGETRTTTGAICNNPDDEFDFFTFEVGQNGERWTVELQWGVPTVDLDLLVFDERGESYGLSFYERPERIELTYLPAGTYYIAVDYFASSLMTSAVDYTLSVTRAGGEVCESAADCAAEYRNQFFRGACVDGACRAIDGDGALAIGQRCDSQSDCGDGLFCPSFFFTSGADTRDTCAPPCGSDTECALTLGTNFVCTTYLAENFCVRKCANDDHCPALPGFEPTTPPWFRLSCDVGSGRCLP